MAHTHKKKQTIEEETGGTGKSPVFWLWVPEEDIDFGVASVRSTDRRELTRDGGYIDQGDHSHPGEVD